MMSEVLRSRPVVAAAAALVCLLTAAPVSHAATPVGDDPVAAVNIFQGTGADVKYSRGSALPLVSEPWALTDWAIQTNGDAGEGRFFDAKSKHFAGLRGTHQPSPWNGDHGQVIFVPQTGPLVLSAKERGADYELISAGPDHIKLRVPSQHMTVELTASARCAFMRLTFGKGQTVGRLVLEPGDPGTLRVDDNGFLATSSYHKLFAAGDYKVLYAAQLDRPITKSGPVSKKQPGYVEFDVSANPVVEIRIGTSMISEDQAKRNATAELAGGFEAVQERTHKAWAEQLGKFEIEGTDEQRKTFYSFLYRVLKFPHLMDDSDASGQRVHYSAWDGKVHPGPEYTDNGLWDSYRSQFPLLSFAYPEQFGDMIEGWLNAYREGGRLPNWPSPGGFNEMPGTHSNILVADAMVKGIKGFDYDTAYAAVRKDSFEAPKGRFDGGRPHLTQMLQLGYVTNEKNDSTVSDTLDYCSDDWAVGQAATVVGKTEDAAILAKRAQAYKNLWDPEVGFMRGKKADGSWAEEKFDEFAWMGPYCEGGPWQSSWNVQHDVAGLADLLGGRAAFAKKLDLLFSLPPTFHTQHSPWGVIHEMTEMAGCDMGQCALGNQPSYAIPYLYVGAGQPWKTEYWTRKAVRTIFNSTPDGFPGDEDTGSAGAWYVLSAIGVYPLTPGHPSYVLTSPALRKVTLHLPGDKTLVIDAVGNTDSTVYVKSRTLNGKPYTNTWISHEDLMAGGTIATIMSDKANERTVTEAELPYSASKGKP
ncbi:MAG: alpha 2-mannosidase [Phycisphaerales bacterium]|nr:alpha 2-mannosidase [Phycisphaerales bacterium]